MLNRLLDIADLHGVVVRMDPELAEAGLLTWRDNRHTILLDEMMPDQSKCFALAHELAHWFLGHYFFHDSYSQHPDASEEVEEAEHEREADALMYALIETIDPAWREACEDLRRWEERRAR
jgi:Zn-dependent peptidase ImmA (M78 family)